MEAGEGGGRCRCHTMVHFPLRFLMLTESGAAIVTGKKLPFFSSLVCR